MTFAYLLIFGTIALLSIAVVILFTWAIRSGQFADFRQGATSIFDDGEPLGEMTDYFPDQHPNQTSDDGETAPPLLLRTANKTDVDHA